MGSSSKEYSESIQRVAQFADRIHLDFADGIFAPTKLLPIEDAWWPIGLIVDFHVMYKKPLEHLEEIIHHSPHLVIVHAEADGIEEFLTELDGLGIKRGVALLKETPVSVIEKYTENLEHVLIFSGDLGHYGGSVDFELLDKVKQVKAIDPVIEIGWDGGVNLETATKLAESGVDVLNVGGAIQKASDPEKEYDKLCSSISNIKRQKTL